MRRAALLAALPLVAGCGASSPSNRTTQTTGHPTPAERRAAIDPGRGPFGAQLLRRTPLRASPGGRVLARLGTRTEFGSIQILAVARVRGHWLAVRAPSLANGRVGWISAADARLLRETWQLEIDLSRRRLIASHDGRRAFSIPVATGQAATPTPTGSFGVTDRLRMSGVTYGCCALALSGHQPHIAQGWGGGTRIAIHGTSEPASIGMAVSHGCLRASEAGMRRLMAVIPLGTTVRIHA